MIENYVTWIEKIQWNYFATFTTPYEMSLKSARRIMNRYHDKMRIENRETLMFWVAEKFKLKDGFHLHALLKAPKPWDKELLWLLWQDVSVYNGQSSKYNRCDVQKRDVKKSAASYMFKDIRYSTKDLFKCDYDLLM